MLRSKTQSKKNGGRGSSPETAAAGGQARERRVAAWVGSAMVVKGDLLSSEDLTIDGRVEGEVTVRDHTLVIGPDGDIRGNIVAKVVTIHGTVTGTITAGERVDVRETGTVEGDIVAPLLAVSDGAILRGRIGAGTSSPGT